MRKTLKIAGYVTALALYLNTGWALGTYMNKISRTNELKETPAIFLAGPERVLIPFEQVERHSPLMNQIVGSMFWPIVLSGLCIMWLIYFAIIGISELVYYLLWLIFGGGIAKLLGVG